MILAFTGAGISKASGISTFMEQPEVRDKLYRSYAQSNPQDYRDTVKILKNSVVNALPNDAHIALFDHDVEIITMNIDGLHEAAGSSVLALHGVLPSDNEMEKADKLYNKPVLYGDQAPNYQKAYEKVLELGPNDTFLIIGASNHTGVAKDLRMIAREKGARIVEIQDDAENKTRIFLESL